MARGCGIYGTAHSWKTTQLMACFMYQYEKTGKPNRLITNDMGGTEHIGEFVKSGIVDAVQVTPQGLIHLNTEEFYPFASVGALLRFLSRGYWLPVFGQQIGGGKVVPKLTPPSAANNNLKEMVGSYGYEGLTTGAIQVFREMIVKAVKLSEDVVAVVEEDSLDPAETITKFAAASRAHYGQTQQQVLDLVANFTALPVDRVFITGHEAKGKDPFTGVTTYGPGLVGSAATAKIPPMLGDLFHCDPYVEQLPASAPVMVANLIPGQPPVPGPLPAPKIVEGVRAWMRRHPEPGLPHILWPAVIRVSVLDTFGVKDLAGTKGNLAKVWERWPGMFLDLGKGDGNNIADFLRFKDEEIQTTTGALAQWKRKMDKKALSKAGKAAEAKGLRGDTGPVDGVVEVVHTTRKEMIGDPVERAAVEVMSQPQQPVVGPVVAGPLQPVVQPVVVVQPQVPQQHAPPSIQPIPYPQTLEQQPPIQVPLVPVIAPQPVVAPQYLPPQVLQGQPPQQPLPPPVVTRPVPRQVAVPVIAAPPLPSAFPTGPPPAAPVHSQGGAPLAPTPQPLAAPAPVPPSPAPTFQPLPPPTAPGPTFIPNPQLPPQPAAPLVTVTVAPAPAHPTPLGEGAMVGLDELPAAPVATPPKRRRRATKKSTTPAPIQKV